MPAAINRVPVHAVCIPALMAVAAVLGGCLQATAPVVVTPQDQAARLVYSCPNGRTLDVTRVQGNTSALVTVDGRTLQLPRDSTMTNGERYTNRLQTLTLFGNSASFDTLGQASYGPCTVTGGGVGVPDYRDGDRRRRGREGDSG